MKTNFFNVIFSLALIGLLGGCVHTAKRESRNQSFDDNWKFLKDSIAGPEEPGFDDTGWRTVDLPHDWSVEDLPNQSDSVIGPFSKKSEGGMSTGYFVGGTGWYRKHFILSPAEIHKIIWINFDGVYMDCDVWLNGHHLGSHPYGYTPFNFELTKFLNPAGEDNVIAVRVRNLGQNSRWYSGSGIYRHVELITADSVHIIPWGVYVTTVQPSPDKATALVNTTIENSTGMDQEIKLQTEILDKDGNRSTIATNSVTVPAGKSIPVNQVLSFSHPLLWSPEHPDLYRARVTVLKGEQVLDKDDQTFGVRTIRVNAEDGLTINGEKILLKGGCMHHDNGLVGSAAFDRAEERRVEILKANGFNAIRTSHNPPSRQFLDACDRLGMLVIDEAFDMWERPKNPQDYSRFFDNWWKKDITSMILRDRNHPSVIFWSIGNENNERADSSGLAIGKELVDEVHSLDPTRPVTEAICDFWDHPGRSWNATAPAFALLDVGGYNYQWGKYESDHKLYPERVMMGTESIPMEALQNWDQVEKHPYVIGDFVWTAMDYMGETAIGHSILDNEHNDFRLPWPWFDSWCGDIDLIGDKKPQSYYRDVVWRNSPIEMLVHAPIPAGRKEVISYWGWPDEWPSWNWKGSEGDTLEVRVFTRCAEVRLELNGKKIGIKPVSDSTMLTAVFRVPWSPGTLKVVGIDSGEDVCSKVLTTTGDPAAIRLVPDRTEIHADRDDLSFVKVEITDQDGNQVPDANLGVKFTISGAGTLAGAGSACPDEMHSFQQPELKTFNGAGMIIVRSTGKDGVINVKAESTGLKSGEAEIRVR